MRRPRLSLRRSVGIAAAVRDAGRDVRRAGEDIRRGRPMASASFVANAGLPGREAGFRTEVNVGARVSIGGRELAIVSACVLVGVITTVAIIAMARARRERRAHVEQDAREG